MADEDYLNNLQEEVRKLHYAIKQKDAIIDKLRQAFSEIGDGSGAEEASLQLKKVESLLSKDDQLDKNSKELENELLKLFTS